MDKIGIRTIVVNFDDEQLPYMSLVQGDAKTRGFDIVICDSDGKEIPPSDDYIVELVATGSNAPDTPYANRHTIKDGKYRVMIPTEALSESGFVFLQLVFYQKSTGAVIHTIEQKCPVYRSRGQEVVESNNLYVDITALRLGIEKIAVMETAYLQVLEDEATRKSNEIKREENETRRLSSESQILSAEKQRVSNEKQRNENESKRITAEKERTRTFNEWDKTMQGIIPNATNTKEGVVKISSLDSESEPYTAVSIGKYNYLENIIIPPELPKDVTEAPGNKVAIKQLGLEEYHKSGTLPRIIQPEEEFAFYGELTANEFLSGDKLALGLGITEGTSVNSDAGWLKFMYKGKIQFIAKNVFRTNISWNTLDNAGLVYGDKTITFRNIEYKVRLPRGIGEDIQPDPRVHQPSYKDTACHNSEWNILMCPISEKAPSNWEWKDNVKSPTPKMAISYAHKDLGVSGTIMSLCQDFCGLSDSYCCARASMGVDFSRALSRQHTSNNLGWRPVLELVE